MRSGGTARKRAAAAGSTAIVTGVAAAAVGLFATPALAATVNYTCDVTPTVPVGGTAGKPITDIPVAAVVSASVTTQASTDGTVHVGDTVTLTDFHVHLTVPAGPAVAALQGLGVTHIAGGINHFPVTAKAADSTVGETVTADGMKVATDVSTAAAADLILDSTPVTGINVGPFKAIQEGPMTFGGDGFEVDLALSGVDTTGAATDIGTATVMCHGADAPVASVTVAENPPPPPPPGTGTGSTGKKPPAHPSPTPTPPHTTAPVQHTTTTTTTSTTSGRATLASTGAPYTIPMTATGAALLLLGGGMLVVGRRRRDLALEGVADDGMTDGEPDAQD